jgi:hypothetical protein
MGRLYEYRGMISSSCRDEIILYVLGNAEIPPTRLTGPDALSKYISDICGSDSEERYYDKLYRYDNLLMLHEIVIPSKENGTPAKIITQARLNSKKPLIFGEREPMEIPENELETMSNEERNRYWKFRWHNGYDKFYYG